MSPVKFKKTPCCPVELKGQGLQLDRGWGTEAAPVIIMDVRWGMLGHALRVGFIALQCFPF